MLDDARAALMRSDWVVKASKLCNLRCRYCYEWNDLADPARMSLETWERVLIAARDHADLVRARHGADVVVTDIIWHGGEPLLLPKDYIEAVLALQREIFPRAWRDNGLVTNQIQTNLYKVDQDKLDLLLDEGFGIGVSYDGAPGVRLTAGGRDSSERVLGNIELFAEQGAPLGIITVMAAHTAHRMTELYERIKGHVRGMTVLPLFDGPAERPMEGVDVSSDAIVAGLLDLFEHWFEDGCRLRLRPLDQALTVVLMTRLGLTAPVYDRRLSGDAVLVVDMDGQLYLPNARYGEERALGDVASQPIAEILDGPAYEASLAADDAARAAICGRCDYFGACSSYPLFGADDGGIAAGRCRIARPLHEGIDAYLTRMGFEDAMLSEMFLEIVDPIREPSLAGPSLSGPALSEPA